MQKLLTINLFQFRRNYYDIAFELFRRIKPENKKLIKIQFMTQPGQPHYLPNIGIDTEVKVFSMHDNYMSKVRYAIKSDTPYSMKLDEDIFVAPNTWNYIIENVERILSGDKAVLMSPILPTGVPTTEYALESWFTQEEINNVYNSFLQTYITRSGNGICPNFPAPDFKDEYFLLNRHTIQSKEWEATCFYESVRQLNHFFKGIHPVRINLNTQKLIAEYIVKNFDKFMNNKPGFCIFSKEPYFCNGVFAIKTKLWKEIVEDDSLKRDGFDEVPLNLYRERHNKYWAFISDGLAFHTIHSNLCEIPNEENPYSHPSGRYIEFSLCQHVRALLNESA